MPAIARRMLTTKVHLGEQAAERLMRETAVRKIRRRYWPGWERFLLGWCAVFHGWMAVTLAAAPYEQLLSRGTAPVFDLASRYVWAGLYAVCAVACAMLIARNRSHLFQAFTWMTVFPLGGVWLSAFTMAVARGEGSALSIVIWVTLFGPWAVAAARIGLGKR